jgi:hypothetical protein
MINGGGVLDSAPGYIYLVGEKVEGMCCTATNLPMAFSAVDLQARIMYLMVMTA